MIFQTFQTLSVGCYNRFKQVSEQDLVNNVCFCRLFYFRRSHSVMMKKVLYAAFLLYTYLLDTFKKQFFKIVIYTIDFLKL